MYILHFFLHVPSKLVNLNNLSHNNLIYFYAQLFKFACFKTMFQKKKEKLSEDQREAGRMPRTIEIELSRDLTDTASPGDVVTITGTRSFFHGIKELKRTKNSFIMIFANLVKSDLL